MIYEGFVNIKPLPQGSLSPIARIDKSGHARVSVFQKKELVEYRDRIADDVKTRYKLTEVPLPKGVPVVMELTFHFLRPKSVSAKKRPYLVVKPDLDKLCRSVGDALTGILYDDDSQIVYLKAMKFYTDYEDEVGVEYSIYHYSEVS